MGGSTDCDLVGANDSVSRHHAEVIPSPGGYALRDLRSANGSWVGLTRGQPDVLQSIRDGDLLRFGEVETMPLDDFDLLFNVNAKGCFLGMQAVARTMRKNGGGSIINASSIEGLAGMPSCTAYAGTKFAIRGMTKAAALELGPKGIRVNSVHPGMIDTPMTRSHGDDSIMEYGGSKVALRRVGYPTDIAPLYVFLASDESSYITGAEIAVDGGATATHAFGG
ncbi:MAG: hypothetical protein NVS3B1_29100 [Marmoricola sp.]